ncbi:hypothetical protein [Geobacillus thermocatenulatus]|uniref:Uncharacterized protein n=1 Tax=Geobacillus thermocatenulatus TaxID=33938 RepID=A0A226Q8L3_9BACL|nr:hypothetical protein [Geobacillus thermocatenulatus]ASS98110.1 hypothetical protein GT3921_02995 [Geobacillus thermocatenulatus]KPC99185.1 hypothetical protein LR69_02602 [Geobacillus sp. BCO2]OXB88853.1 hypothetical protein B9L19_01715 [Geobacillus thermocatenulatus]RAN22295.1 hypothetical protein VC88_12090 [Geobacillus sp. A8]
MNIYLADFVICERNGHKHTQKLYHIYIKEMKNPFSVRLKTIAPASFTDSLRSLKNEGGRMRFSSEGEALFRTITCSSEAQLYFVFKCTSQLYMFIVKLDLRQKKFTVALYEWNEPKQKYIPIRVDEWLAMEKQLIYEVLQSIYLVDDRRVSHLFANLSRPKRGTPHSGS